MKKLGFFMLGCLALGQGLFVLPSYASTNYSCSGRGSNGTEYRVFLSQETQSAVVSQVSPSGDRELAHLTCSDPSSDMDSRDHLLPVFRCFEPNIRDAGYSLVLLESQTTGDPFVVLSEVSFLGEKVIGRLPCVSGK